MKEKLTATSSGFTDNTYEKLLEKAVKNDPSIQRAYRGYKSGIKLYSGVDRVSGKGKNPRSQIHLTQNIKSGKI